MNAISPRIVQTIKQPSAKSLNAKNPDHRRPLRNRREYVRFEAGAGVVDDDGVDGADGADGADADRDSSHVHAGTDKMATFKTTIPFLHERSISAAASTD